MNVAAALALQSLPFAGLVVAAGEDEDWGSLLLVVYVAVLGLLLSAIAMTDDYYELTTFIGLAVEPLP